MRSPRTVSALLSIWAAACLHSSGCDEPDEPDEITEVERKRTSNQRAFVAGQIRGAGGQRVTGASVTVHPRDPAGYVHRVESGPSGGYLFAHVAFGEYQIGVSAIGYRWQKKLLQVDGMEERVDFVLQSRP